MVRLMANAQPIAKNPWIVWLSIWSVFCVAVGLSTFFFGLHSLLSFSDQPFVLLLGDWFNLGAGLFILLFTLRFFVVLRFWLHLELRRFGSVIPKESAPELVSSPPLAFAYQLPLNITLRFKRSHLLGFLIGFLVLSSPLFIGLFFQTKGSDQATDVFLVLLVLFLFVALPLLCFIPLFRFRSNLEVTAQGMKIGLRGIAWREVRLFARYKVPRLIGSQRTQAYELSGQTTVLIWMRIDPQSPWVIWEPVLPAEDYQRCMQQLSVFIGEHTGLPLVDLTA